LSFDLDIGNQKELEEGQPIQHEDPSKSKYTSTN